MTDETHATPCPTELTGEEINDLPVMRYEGAIDIVVSDMDMEKAIPRLLLESVLGFDIEIRPSFLRGESYPPAIVQLATCDRVVIVQLKHLSSLQPLAQLFSLNHPLKVGVGIADDLRKLKEIVGFEPVGFVDLGKMASELGLQASGVRTLAANLMGFRIAKGSARLSNWERDKLTSAQITYAATDAWICREIYFALQTLPQPR